MYACKYFTVLMVMSAKCLILNGRKGIYLVQIGWICNMFWLVKDEKSNLEKNSANGYNLKKKHIFYV